MPSRYNIIHALALTIVMFAAVSKNFWHNFIHGGFTQPPQVPVLLFALGCQVGLTLLLLLFLWASTLFRARDEVSGEIPRTPPLKAIKFGAVAFAPICLMAFGLQWIGTTLLDKVLNLPVHGQDLIEWLKPETYPLSVRLVLIFIAVIEAPLLEEALFRGVLFRGLTKAMPVFLAMAISGLVFALIHVNAATLVPLWYLGVAFAWLYWRTKSILAPMTAHLLFNLTNLVLVLSGLVS